VKYIETCQLVYNNIFLLYALLVGTSANIVSYVTCK